MKNFSNELPDKDKLFATPRGQELPIGGLDGDLFYLQYNIRSGIYLKDENHWVRLLQLRTINLEQSILGSTRVQRYTNIENRLTADNCGVLLVSNVDHDLIHFTLPPASLCAGLTFTFKKINSNGSVEIIGINDDELIDGLTDSYVLIGSYESVRLYCCGQQWYKI